MKHISLLVLIVLSSSACFPQSARDYFFPASGKNVSVYSKPESWDEGKTTVYFKDMGDSALITTIIPKSDGENDWKEEVIRIEDSQISRVKIKSKSSPQTFGNEAILKLPDGERSTSEHVAGSLKNIYLTEFLTIKIDGKDRKALRITRSAEMNRSGKKLMSISDYFVQGIGFYKRTFDDVTLIEILKDQKYDPNPPTLN
jgi:hypothetical protein